MELMSVNIDFSFKEIRIIREALEWWLNSDNDLEDDEIIVKCLLENMNI